MFSRLIAIEMNLLVQFLEGIPSTHTRRAYRADLLSFFGTTDLQQTTVECVTPGEVDAYFRKGEKAGRSQSSLNRRRAALHRFFDEMTERGVIHFNPARHPRVRKPRAKSRTAEVVGSRPDPVSEKTPSAAGSKEFESLSSLNLARALSREKVSRIIGAIPLDTRKGRRDLVAAMLCVHTGLRRSEIVTLSTSHLHRINRYCIINVQNRQIPLKDPFGSVLESIARTETGCLRDRPFLISVSNQNDGDSLTGNALYRIVRRIGDCIPDRSVTPDLLRLTGARMALSAGASISSVRIHLGHQPRDEFESEVRSEHRLQDSASLKIDVGGNACRSLLKHWSSSNDSAIS